MPKRDRLDIGEPQRKAWEEFAIQFSASRLLSLLLAKIQDLVPEFFAELKQEFDDAYANSDHLADEGEGWDPDWVTLTTPAYEFWTDRAGAAELYEQLFPHADKDFSHGGDRTRSRVGWAALGHGTLFHGSYRHIRARNVAEADWKVSRTKDEQ